jgi:hypothetical protein
MSPGSRPGIGAVSTKKRVLDKPVRRGELLGAVERGAG